MVVGLNGAGKTTTSAKLALRLKNEGRRPLLVACDLVRPAAVDQLATLAEQIEVPVYKPAPGSRDVVAVAREALEWARTQNGTVMIFDTAGRQEVDEALIDELRHLHAFLSPRETLLVVDAATGQQAVNVAQTFDRAVNVTGIVLTKLDGDARGGAALSMRSVTGKPIKFSGEGEKLDQFGPFVPGRMADRILGMGDIVGLVEHAAARIDEEQAAKSMDRMMSGKFDFNDFLDQMKMMQNLGPLEGLLGLLPGFGKIKKQLPDGALDPRRMKHMEAIVLSMTAKERSNPNLLNPSRRRRIAAGCGTLPDGGEQAHQELFRNAQDDVRQGQDGRHDETDGRHEGEGRQDARPSRHGRRSWRPERPWGAWRRPGRSLWRPQIGGNGFDPEARLNMAAPFFVIGAGSTGARMVRRKPSGFI
ncbi:MAG: signal recognition particle protein [Akkermansia muciniphila]